MISKILHMSNILGRIYFNRWVNVSHQVLRGFLFLVSHGPTLCNPMDWQPARPSSGICVNIGMRCHFLLPRDLLNPETKFKC